AGAEPEAPIRPNLQLGRERDCYPRQDCGAVLSSDGDVARGFGIEVDSPAIERSREPHEASPRAGEDGGPRQLAEFVTQIAILGTGALQRERVLIRHALVFAGERLNKRKILES